MFRTITINSKEFRVRREALTVEEIIHYVYPHAKHHPSAYTIIYTCCGPQGRVGGSLHDGDTIEPREGMFITCVITGRA